jgi:fructosamine-3-kinase
MPRYELDVDLTGRVTALLGVGVLAAFPLGGAITGDRWQLRLADGRDVFVKARPDAPDGFFAAEADGLDWLGAAGGPPLPMVLGVDRDLLVLPWLQEGPPVGVEQLGRELATLHVAGAPRFGAARDGWIGAAPLDNRCTRDWPEFYAERRILPYVRRLRDDGLDAADAAVFDAFAERLAAVAGPAEPPARLHGDLWTGNVVWSRGRGWLVDPAAHGGHRETDLAMLALFGEEWVPRLLDAYDEVAPLAAGWRERRRLHQVHPLLVHAVLFGGNYLEAALAAARGYL